jgi:archaellum component FlaC
MVKCLVKDSTYDPVKVGDEIKLESLGKPGRNKKKNKGPKQPSKLNQILSRLTNIENDMSDVKGILQRNNLH